MKTQLNNEVNSKVLIALNRRTLVNYLAWEFGVRGAVRIRRGVVPYGESDQPFARTPQKVRYETWRGHEFHGWSVPVVLNHNGARGATTARDWRDAQARVMQAAAYEDGRIGRGLNSHDLLLADASAVSLI
jgi:hypothetical protein